MTVNPGALDHSIADLLVLDGILGPLDQQGRLRVALGEVDGLERGHYWSGLAGVPKLMLLEVLCENAAAYPREGVVCGEDGLRIVLVHRLPALRLGGIQPVLHIMQALDVVGQAAVLEDGHRRRVVLRNILVVAGVDPSRHRGDTRAVHGEGLAGACEVESHLRLGRVNRESRGRRNGPGRLRSGWRDRPSLAGVQQRFRTPHVWSTMREACRSGQQQAVFLCAVAKSKAALDGMGEGKE